MSEVILSPSQQSTMDAFIDFIKDPEENAFVLAGQAGTGKSFLVKHLIDKVMGMQNSNIYSFHSTATTNKAAQVLGDMIGGKATTIHNALGLVVKNNNNTGESYLEAARQGVILSNSLLVVDEASMANGDLLYHIALAVENAEHCKVLFVGDSYQLPPVGEITCPVFTEIDNIHYLTDIQRQAADSNIITFSNEYRKKLDNLTLPWPTIPHNDKDTFYYDNPADWGHVIQDTYQSPHNPDDYRILAWTNETVHGYNKWVRNIVGRTEPFEVDEVLVSNSPIIIREEMVAGIGATYQVKSASPAIEEGVDGYVITLTGIESGGHLRVFQPTDHRAKASLLKRLGNAARKAPKGQERSKKWREFFEIQNGWGDFRPVHSQTVHKSQGSTYKEVFIDINDISKNRSASEIARLMYVAVTRASDRIHLYGGL